MLGHKFLLCSGARLLSLLVREACNGLSCPLEVLWLNDAAESLAVVVRAPNLGLIRLPSIRWLLRLQTNHSSPYTTPSHVFE